MKSNTEVAYIIPVGIQFVISIYTKSTKKKVSEYGVFENAESAMAFAKEHHIQITSFM